MKLETEARVRNPLFQPYRETREFLKAIEGAPATVPGSMLRRIQEQTGTPKDPVDWSDPDTWIPERLHGEEAELALKIWKGSGKTLNPRHVYGSYLLMKTYALTDVSEDGKCRLTDRGRAFVAEEPSVIALLDEREGLFQLLGQLSVQSPARRAELLPEWREYLHRHSRFHSESVVRDALRRRLVNLYDRGLAAKSGMSCVITEVGRAYMQGVACGREEVDIVGSAVAKHNEAQLLQLRELLKKMHPYQFEHLVRDLLEAMGYEEVTVTQQSGDKGVDVIAKVKFGITTIKEVVQVKRFQGTIGRDKLDQLRGALPYHGAIRGTLITLGKFTAGCKDASLFPGAAPVGLIDGDRLIELLREHQVGMRRREIHLFDVDMDLFDTPSPDGTSIEVESMDEGDAD